MNIDIIGDKSAVSVYFSIIPDAAAIGAILPKEREDEIKSVSNERVKREKYFAWRLLEYALSDALGLKLIDAKLFKDKNGKWKSELCEFSISHSASLVAVAISHAPVGIDIEPLGTSRPRGFAKKTLAESELSLFSSLPVSEKDEFLLTRWCIKEAIYKKEGAGVFSPSKIQTNAKGVTERRIFLGEKEYFCAVCATPGAHVSFFDNPINFL